MKRWTVLGCVAVLVFAGVLSAEPGGLKEGDLVAICGDSITEQKIYSVYIEDYLLMCRPVAGARAMQFGWNGQTSWTFLPRMERDVLPFKPTVATTCYGMNDGGYSPMTPEKAKHYHDSQQAVVRKLKEAGVRFIVVGSPGVVDSDMYEHSRERAAMYNKTLAELRDIARTVATEEGVTFANVHDLMFDAMALSKEKYGPKYPFAGLDGVHPAISGHVVMAYAFLKALGCDGEIGTISVDLTAGSAKATEGHKVLAGHGGSFEIESSRYPFCVSGDPSNANFTAGVLEFIPFDQDLNRFLLVVTNPGGERLKVTWGKASKEFTAAALAKGINLAVEFRDNPFSVPFAAVHRKVMDQQAVETRVIKELLFSTVGLKQAVPDEQEALGRISAKLVQQLQAGADAERSYVTPVRHTIRIEVVR